MIDMEQIARRAVACDGWRWMRGMLCPTDEDGYAARILHVGLTDRQSETADSYDGGGIITRGCILEGSLPDLTDPATKGALLSLCRVAGGCDALHFVPEGDRWVAHTGYDYHGEPEPSEAEAMVCYLEDCDV